MKNLPALTDTDATIVDAEIIDETYPDAKEIKTEPDAKSDRLAELEARRAKSTANGQIDNASLWAGSPMYFYCKFCGIKTDILPENYFLSTPSKICDECQVLIDFGWHDGKMPSFPTVKQVQENKQREAEAERKMIARKAAAAKGAATRAANKAAQAKAAKKTTKSSSKKPSARGK
jgi:hypothetical protein